MLTEFDKSRDTLGKRHVCLCALQGSQVMDVYVEKILETWRGATLTDYAHVILAIVVVAWFITRYEK